jgi:hypothetical protein
MRKMHITAGRVADRAGLDYRRVERRRAITAAVILCLVCTGWSCGRKIRSPEQEIPAAKAALSTEALAFIRDMLHRSPCLHARLENDPCAGRPLQVTVYIDGLSEGDSITSGPSILVRKNIQDVDKVLISARRETPTRPGERWFGMSWTPREPGRYGLCVEAGTNHIRVDSGAAGVTIGIGSLRFSKGQVLEAIGADSLLRGWPLDWILRKHSQLEFVRLVVHVPSAAEYERSRLEERKEVRDWNDAIKRGEIKMFKAEAVKK